MPQQPPYSQIAQEPTEIQPRPSGVAHATEYRRRMLQWPNPVEYVNDMYGCHPGEGDTEYFRTVFGK